MIKSHYRFCLTYDIGKKTPKNGPIQSLQNKRTPTLPAPRENKSARIQLQISKYRKQTNKAKRPSFTPASSTGSDLAADTPGVSMPRRAARRALGVLEFKQKIYF